MREYRTNRTILSSTIARIVAFFVLAISVVVGIGGAFFSIFLWEADVYTRGVEPLLKDVMRSQVVWSDVNYIKALYQEEDIEGIRNFLLARNIDIEMMNIHEKEVEDAVMLFSNYDGSETKYSFNCFTEIPVTYKVEQESKIVDESKIDEEENTDVVDEAVVEPEYVTEEQEILFRVYVDDTFFFHDEYKSIHDWGMILEKWIYVIPLAAVISILLCLVSFIFLMCSAGHHRGQIGISGGVLYFFHFDILTAVFGVVALIGLICIVDLINYGGFIEYMLGLGLLVLEVIWCTIYCMEFAVELKLGTLFKHTFIWTILKKFGRAVKVVGHGFGSIMRGFPLVMNVMIVYIGYSVVQFVALAFFCIIWYMDAGVLLLCFLEKIVLLPIVLYFALVCKKLQQGSKALAEGNLTYKLDTSKMILGFKEHGENLNRIGEGIAVAVEERMKSEHLKTELITNVSHDLKTPLTSIINYADLLGTAVSGKTMGEENGQEPDGAALYGATAEYEEIDREQIAEYSEVLLRQSKRLKKLLEDLVEASKATTGNVEVNLAPCEISVILSQAIGEYEQRFAEKQLDLIVKQPKEPVNIQADGRHLWRVFDNLMNNICKYAQENTRVYLTVEREGDMASIVFRNMSKFPLDISGEELQERFVRGDKSRHMEGNGLGLSIAGSLVELQNGKMEIVTDGDLFKVSICFPVLKTGESN